MKNKEPFEFLENIIKTPTVSGFESRNAEKIAKYCIDFADGFFDGFEILPSGSILLSKKCGNSGAKKLVIDAHIDTIGFIVKEMCGDGFVKVTGLGGVDPYILPATPVILHGKEDISGVFTSVPPHLANKDGKEELKISDLFVDTGLTQEELSKICRVGTPCSFDADITLLQNGIVASHGLDDKACVAAAIYACKMLANRGIRPECDVYIHLSAGEEKTMLGAKTLPYLLDADGCIVLDVNFAYTQGVQKHESLILGKGSGISYSASIKRELTDFIADTAEKHNLPLQKVVEMKSTGTNATMLHKNGIPCAVLSVPLKNMHTNCECVSLSDIENCADVLCAVISDFHKCENIEEVLV